MKNTIKLKGVILFFISILLIGGIAVNSQANSTTKASNSFIKVNNELLPVLKYNDNSTHVKYLQAILLFNGYYLGNYEVRGIDGVFGSKTLEAVKSFQKDNDLKVDGIVGINTWSKLIYTINSDLPLLKLNTKSNAVAYLQTYLVINKYNLGSYGVKKDGIDGVFGSMTLSAVKSFQSKNGLVVDGIVGSKTWHKLFESFKQSSSSLKKVTKNNNVANTNKNTKQPTTDIKYSTLKYKSPDKKNVALLQTMLIHLDYDLGKHGIDGVFGKDTLTAVKKFQKDYNLKVDGIVGKETWKKLTEDYYMSK